MHVRQTYTRTLKVLARAGRFRSHPKKRARTVKADKKVKTIAGRLVRELKRNLQSNSKHQARLDLFDTIFICVLFDFSIIKGKAIS